MKPIKVIVYKKNTPTFVKQDEIPDCFKDYSMVICNLTAEQKDKILEYLGTLGKITYRETVKEEESV